MTRHAPFRSALFLFPFLLFFFPAPGGQAAAKGGGGDPPPAAAGEETTAHAAAPGGGDQPPAAALGEKPGSEPGPAAAAKETPATAAPPGGKEEGKEKPASGAPPGGKEEDKEKPASGAASGAGKGGGEDEVAITATRRKEKTFDLPAAVTVTGEKEFVERAPRTLPEALARVPSVMVQKTSYGQQSPYIRGFTGYRTLVLIDGIRLNNSVFRSGPNQYASTIDPLSAGRVETVRGPASVLYGSDAVGGVVNVIPKRRLSYEEGFHLGGRIGLRWSSAEDSFVERFEVEGNAGERLGFFGGLSLKDFGDLRAGRGRGVQENTGYSEADGDFRLDWHLRDDARLTLGWQDAGQYHVPRTHKTIYSKPFHGTEPGRELRRDLDQRRRLAYARLDVDRFLGVFDSASFALSGQRQEQDRNRVRTGGKRDLSGFTVDTLGLSASFVKKGLTGAWTFGAESYRDRVGSYRKDFKDGVLVLEEIQGPVGDRAGYGLSGVYVQNEKSFGRLDVITGVRFTQARARADRVDDPSVPGSDPAVPGNVMAIHDSYRAAAGSVRGLYHLDENTNLFGGVSQGFRAPDLSDLTAFDATSAVELPSPGLDPEYFTALEAGLKARRGPFQARLALWRTFIDDMIVQSPTGEFVEGTPVVRKDNAGNGFLQGVEADASLGIGAAWTASAAVAWMEGRVDQFLLPSGEKVREPVSRVMPLTGRGSLRYEPPGEGVWVEFESIMAAKQDELALRDEEDVTRIPPGGTPGYAVFNVRGGIAVSESLSLTVAVENLTDKDYRVHGSGINEAGLNLVVGLWYRF